MTIVFAVIAGLGGIVVGSLLNILADDLPLRDNPRPPHYPDGTPRLPSAWLGIAAFLTGQRTASGPPPPAPEPEPEPGDPPAEDDLDDDPDEDYYPRRSTSRVLGWRHPLLEIGTGLAFALLVLAFPDEPNLWAWLVYTAIMALITVIDLEHRLILFVVIVPSCIFALIVAAVAPPDDKAFIEFLIGGVVGFALFFAMFLGGIAFAEAAGYEGVAFGFGDVMLATLSGLMIGWRAFIFASLITVFAGAIGSVMYMAVGSMIGRGHRRFTPLPYGPYIVFGTLVMLFFREEVQDLVVGSVY